MAPRFPANFAHVADVLRKKKVEGGWGGVGIRDMGGRCDGGYIDNGYFMSEIVACRRGTTRKLILVRASGGTECVHIRTRAQPHVGTVVPTFVVSQALQLQARGLSGPYPPLKPGRRPPRCPP